MAKYSAVPFLANMIDALSDEIGELERDMIDSDPRLRDKYRRVITILKRSQATYYTKRKILIEELKAIESDNPEVYRMIYLHDLKRWTWERAFNEACKGLWSDCPECYCRTIVKRYLKKKGFEE